MEWTAEKEEKVHKVVAGFSEAIICVGTFEFTYEQWANVEGDIRAAEDRESALIKELDKLKEHGTTEKEELEREEYGLNVQDDTGDISDELKDLDEALDVAEQQMASIRSERQGAPMSVAEQQEALIRAEHEEESLSAPEQLEASASATQEESMNVEEQKEAYMKLADVLGPTEKSPKNAGYLFQDIVKNSKQNGANSKQSKKDKKRIKKNIKKDEKLREKIAKKEEKVVQLHLKLVDQIMKRYNKDVKVQREKEEQRRKKIVKIEIKAQKMLEKEMKRIMKVDAKDEKKKKTPIMVEKDKKHDTKKETENNKGQEMKEARNKDGVKAMEKNKTKKEAKKNKDEKKKESQTMENIDNDGKKNSVSANIQAFLRIFSCNKHQKKDEAVV
ncbi:nucleolar protein 58-like [Mytilus edulis]|uniref:nucleolar protein 58-like n=1 Tax=Mytilus edulis TaxID=6550 RepID=UPI0039EF6052